MSKIRFFVDMDGVTAKFEPASVEEQNERGFFASRKPEVSVLQALILLQAHEEVELYSLSSVYQNGYAEEEKRAWNKKHCCIPEKNQIYVPYGEHKECYVPGGVRSTDVLIDDFSPNLHKWPGISIKMYNGINGTKGTWRGYHVNSNMDPIMLEHQLRGIALIATGGDSV